MQLFGKCSKSWFENRMWPFYEQPNSCSKKFTSCWFAHKPAFFNQTLLKCAVHERDGKKPDSIDLKGLLSTYVFDSIQAGSWRNPFPSMYSAVYHKCWFVSTAETELKKDLRKFCSSVKGSFFCSFFTKNKLLNSPNSTRFSSRNNGLLSIWNFKVPYFEISQRSSLIGWSICVCCGNGVCGSNIINPLVNLNNTQS